MKTVIRLIALGGLVAAASCSRGAVPPSPGLGNALKGPGAFPPTVHVIPFYDYTKSGYGVPSGTSYGGLIGSQSTLYGATMLGGSTSCSTSFGSGSTSGCGIVYRLVRSGKRKYKLDVLHTFEGSPNDGAASFATLVADKSGNLFGTTYFGGKYNAGTVFKLQPSSSGYTETILHSFGHRKDGAYPVSGVIEVNGMLYGTTLGGGAYSNPSLCGTYGQSPDGRCGTVYSVDPATGAEQILHSFGKAGDGASPDVALLDVGSTLYGTTDLGGAVSRCGTVFSLGTDGRQEKVVHSFRNVPDACNPFASLISVHGTLYGTTCCGGRNFCSNNCTGTLFSVDPSSGDEKVLHNFGNPPDGSEPHAAVVYVNGVLYGTTDIGGGTSCFSGEGCGTIFSYSLSSSSSPYSSLYQFTGKTDGFYPADALLYSHGTFYGTTTAGGKNGLGTGVKLRL